MAIKNEEEKKLISLNNFVFQLVTLLLSLFAHLKERFPAFIFPFLNLFSMLKIICFSIVLLFIGSPLPTSSNALLSQRLQILLFGIFSPPFLSFYRISKLIHSHYPITLTQSELKYPLPCKLR